MNKLWILILNTFCVTNIKGILTSKYILIGQIHKNINTYIS